jgi:hypothetical protein
MFRLLSTDLIFNIFSTEKKADIVMNRYTAALINILTGCIFIDMNARMNHAARERMTDITRLYLSNMKKYKQKYRVNRKPDRDLKQQPALHNQRVIK